jgi:hypothetical protein
LKKALNVAAFTFLSEFFVTLNVGFFIFDDNGRLFPNSLAALAFKAARLAFEAAVNAFANAVRLLGGLLGL